MLYGLDLAKRDISRAGPGRRRRGLHRRHGLPPRRRHDGRRHLWNRLRRRPHQGRPPGARRRLRPGRGHLHLRPGCRRPEGRHARVQRGAALRGPDLRGRRPRRPRPVRPAASKGDDAVRRLIDEKQADVRVRDQARAGAVRPRDRRGPRRRPARRRPGRRRHPRPGLCAPATPASSPACSAPTCGDVQPRGRAAQRARARATPGRRARSRDPPPRPLRERADGRPRRAAAVLDHRAARRPGAPDSSATPSWRMLQHPPLVGVDRIRRAPQGRSRTRRSRVVRDGIAATLDDHRRSPTGSAASSPRCPSRRATSCSSSPSPPIPERSERELAGYARAIVASLIDRDLLRDKAELLGRLQRTDATDRETVHDSSAAWCDRGRAPGPARANEPPTRTGSVARRKQRLNMIAAL